MPTTDSRILATLHRAGIRVRRVAASRNHSARPRGVKPDAIVIHYTDIGWAPTLRRLRSPKVEASTHYVIDRNGSIAQLVSVKRKAWHAGVSSLDGRARVNDFSIGVDLVFVPSVDPAYTEAQYGTLGVLLRLLCETFRIPPERVVGHEDVALPKGRKTDPGPEFDWQRLGITRS